MNTATNAVLNDQDLNAAIDARTHERVTEQGIVSRIADVTYIQLPDSTVTICNITMVNGFSVRGESACVDPRNFDSQIGNSLAYKDAFRKLWAFEGYLLAEKRANNGEGITWTRDERERHIAAACHEINSAYCQALGDDSQPNWDAAPDWQKQSAINGVRLHMDNPNARPEASHESWMAEKAASGWVWGPIKDADAKTHPCMVPFSELPREQQAKDFIFRAVVHALA